MTAASKTLFIEQGATFILGFNWYRESTTTPGTPGVAYDLTGCVVRMQIRRLPRTDILVSATSDGASPMIILGGTTGRIDVKLPATATDALALENALYDLEVLMVGGDVHRLLSGNVVISQNITA